MSPRIRNNVARFSLCVAAAGAGLAVLYGFKTTDLLFVVAGLTGFAGLLTAIVAVAGFGSAQGRAKAIGAMLLALISLAGLPFVSVVDQASSRAHSQCSLKQIGLALHAYEAKYDHLPAAAICDREGRPLLSWRVALLEFVEAESLYKEFHLDEPWDSPHNLSLLPRMPAVYRSCGTQTPERHMTFYRVFVGPGTAFERDGLSLGTDFPDGTSNTIFVIEAGEAVPWTKPDELEYHPDKPLPPLGGMFRVRNWLDRIQFKSDLTQACFADGSVRVMSRGAPEAAIRAAITRNGGEKTDLSQLHQ